ncbi:MAG: DsbA family protein, partial [Chitinophagaceae bacterium]
QILLLSEFILFNIAPLPKEYSFSVMLFYQTILIFLLPVTIWYFIKPHFLNEQETKTKKYELARLKNNKEIFNSLLFSQKRITQNSDGLGIMLGNPNAINTLVKVCNPYCGPCAKAHAAIEKLLEENKNLKVQIIFNATNDENDIKALPAKHLLAVAENNSEVKTKHALDDWYLAEKKDYNLFAEKYKLNGELKMQDKKIDMMKNWCDKVDIQFTPTIFYNGYQLPSVYAISDLKYFLAE